MIWGDWVLWERELRCDWYPPAASATPRTGAETRAMEWQARTEATAHVGVCHDDRCPWRERVSAWNTHSGPPEGE